MKIVITLLITLFLICSCKKEDSIIQIKVSFKSNTSILKARFGFREDDTGYYYSESWPKLIGPNNYYYYFPNSSLDEVTENHFERILTVTKSEVEYMGIYTKIDSSLLSAGETATYEITITDEQTGEIKYERKMETLVEYNRELIQL